MANKFLIVLTVALNIMLSRAVSQIEIAQPLPTKSIITVGNDVPADLGSKGLSYAGDFNNDGYGDFIVGATVNVAGSLGGCAYVIYGKMTAPTAALDVNALGTNGVKFCSNTGTDAL